MSKRTKRLKRERVLDNLAAAKMVRALKGEKVVSVMRVVITAEVDLTQAATVQRLQSFARKWQRETPSATIEITQGELGRYEGV